jgi:hypothetical protein
MSIITVALGESLALTCDRNLERLRERDVKTLFDLSSNNAQALDAVAKLSLAQQVQLPRTP